MIKTITALSALLLMGVSASAANNLVNNGDFEKGSLGWSYEKWKKAPEPGTLERDQPYAGKYSYRMHNEKKGLNRLYRGSIAIKPGQAYQLSMVLKCDKVPSGDVKVKLLCWAKKNGKNTVLGWVANPPKSGVNTLISTGGDFNWKKFTVVLKPGSFQPGTETVTLFFERSDNSAGNLFIDSVEMIPFAGTAKKSKVVSVAATPAVVDFTPEVNKLPGDTSFETTTCNWGGIRDKIAAFDGFYAMKIPVEKPKARSCRYYKVIAEGKPYVLSFYAKSDKPVILEADAWHLRYKIMTRCRFNLTNKWRRCEMKIPVQLKVRGLHLALKKLGRANVWIDAVQLNEGDKALAFTPSRKFFAALQATGELGETFFTGSEPVKMQLNLRNNDVKPLALRIKADVESYTGVSKPVSAKSIVLPPVSSKRINLNVADRRDRGYYVCRVDVESKKNGHLKCDLPFVVVDRPLHYGEKSFFGLHPFGSVALDAQKRIGMCFVRNFRMWKYLRKKDGKFIINDSSWKPFVDRNIILMECMKVTLAPKSAFRNDGKLKKIDDYLEFCKAHIDKYGKYTKYWEIENEPDLEFPKELKTNSKAKAARYYAEIVNRAAAMIRKERPGAVILAGGVSGVDFNNNFVFLREFMKHAGKSVDVIPVHPYANARFIGPEASDIGPDVNHVLKKLKNLRKLIDSYGGKQDIWIGELGWALNVFEDCMSTAAMRHAAYMMRSMLLAKTAGVKKVMYFLAEGCIGRDKYAYGLWRDGRPLPAVGVYSAAAQLLEGAEAGPEISNGDIRSYAYKGRDGKPFVAVWLQRGTKIKAKFKLNSKQVEARDMFNNPVSANADKGGLVLDISDKPLFIIGRNISMSGLCKAVKEADYACAPAVINIRPVSGRSFACRVINKLPGKLTGSLKVGVSGAKLDKTTAVLDVQPGNVSDYTFNLKSGNLNGKTIQAQLIQDRKVKVRVNKFIEMVKVERLKSGKPQGNPEIILKTRADLLPNDPGVGWNGPQDLSVFASTAWDDKNLYLFIKVRDDIHCQKYFPGRLWSGDSVQLVIDTQADAAQGVYNMDANDYEMSFGLTTRKAETGINYIYEKGRLKDFASSINLNISRKGDITGYRIAIPWQELKLKPKPGLVFGMNFIVNDDDGAGRGYWLGITPGIGEMKYPFGYKKFILE